MFLQECLVINILKKIEGKYGIKFGGEIFLSKSISIGKDDLNIRYGLLTLTEEPKQYNLK